MGQRTDFESFNLRVVGASAFCVMVFSVAAHSAPAPQDAGRRLVERYCTGCHAVGPKGESPERLAPPFRALNLRYSGESLPRAIEEGILNGHPMMPSFNFRPAERRAIIDYLKATQDRQAA